MSIFDVAEELTYVFKQCTLIALMHVQLLTAPGHLLQWLCLHTRYMRLYCARLIFKGSANCDKFENNKNPLLISLA